jgi:hypothetical protein
LIDDELSSTRSPGNGHERQAVRRRTRQRGDAGLEHRWLLYHLDAIEVFGLLERMRSVRAILARAADAPVTQLDCTRIRDAVGWTATTTLEDDERASWEWARQLPYERLG